MDALLRIDYGVTDLYVDGIRVAELGRVIDLDCLDMSGSLYKKLLWKRLLHEPEARSQMASLAQLIKYSIVPPSTFSSIDAGIFAVLVDCSNWLADRDYSYAGLPIRA